MDQWNKPGYRPGNNYYNPNGQQNTMGGYQRPYPAQPAQQPPSVPQPTRLSREEQMEAKRLAEQARFSFDGYQVVRREFISHNFDPAMTIRGNSITFNNSCISKLENATYVQFLINPAEQRLLIRPCEEGARDAVRWCIVREDKRKSRQITCGLFTAKLYDMMGWEALYRYKLQGTRINYQGEQLYVFDLTSTEAFLPQVKETDENGTVKRKKAVPMYPADWRDSFGIPVQEHAASTQINLLDGYAYMETTADNPKAAQMPMEIIDQETGEVTKV